MTIGQHGGEAAETLAAAVMDAAPEGFALFDTAFRYVHVNEALARINGVPAAEHVGRTPAEVLPAVPAGETLEHLRRVLTTGRPVVDLEIRGTTRAAPDDERTWLVSCFPVRDATEAIARLGAIVIDITDRKRAEQRAGLLADVGAILDEVMGLEDRLDRFVHALVPRLGDSCTIALRTSDGGLRCAAVAHVDPEGERAAAALPALDERKTGGQRTPRGTIVLDPTDADGSVVHTPMEASGRVLGQLVLTRSRPRRWTHHEIGLVEELARRAAVTVETARLYESERSARERMGRLQAVTAALSEALTPADVAAAVLDEGVGSIGGSMAAVWQLDPDGEALELVGHRGWRERTSRTPMQTIDPKAQLPVPDAVRRRRPVWLPDAEAKAAAYPALAQRAVGASPEALYVLPLTSGAEPVGALALCFDDPARLDGETRAFAAALGAQCAQALERARLYEAERQVAGILQRSLLPGRMPQVREAAFAVRYLPAAGLEAGGDFYEAMRLPSGAVGVAVGDVVGRGATAAAVMGQLRSALRAHALEGAPPGVVLSRLSRFAETVDGALAATAIYAVVDPASGTVRYACAGHPYPVVSAPDGRAALLRGGRGLPLGVAPDEPYEEAEVPLEPGATLLLYTDGLVERRDESFDGALDRLVRTVGELAAAPLPAVLDEVVSRQRAGSLADDVALLAVRLATEAAGVRRLQIPAEPTAVAAARRQLRGWLREAGLADTELTDVLLAAGEAIANAVEHAYVGSPGEVDVELHVGEEALEVRVGDRGRWRRQLGDADRGRGFTIMRAVMDEVEVQRAGSGTWVVLRRALARPTGERRDAGSAERGPMAVPPPEVEIHASGAMTVRLSGDVDMATAGDVGTQLAGLAGSGLLVADLTSVSHVDSTGLRMLVETGRRAGGRLTVIAPPGSPARRTLDIAGVGALLSVRDA